MNIPIFSFVAYSGTGKTTLLEKVVAALKARGVRVAMLKHDAHEFEVDKAGKDTHRFTQAGADVVAIANARHAAIMINRPTSFDELIAQISDVDVILTEGWKSGNFPKIAMRRAATGNDFPTGLTNVVALISDNGAGSYGGSASEYGTALPCFGLNDVDAIADFVMCVGV